MTHYKKPYQKMKSEAFKDGFLQGFSSPFSVFFANKAYESFQLNSSVEKAWENVNRILSDAVMLEGEFIEKNKETAIEHKKTGKHRK